MNVWADAIIILVVLVNLKVLGSSRIVACIRLVAFQGIILGLLPLLAGISGLTLRMILAASVSTALKGLVFPWLLMRTVRDSGARREVHPIVGYTTSLLAGIAMIGAALWMGHRLPLPASIGHSLVLPAAFFTVMVGLFMIVARKQAIMQVLGYLVMENGIYTFGMAISASQPLMVELGILLDVFMAVFVMGITIYHINREFDHIDTDRMSALKD
jgi:hydrogenase-4 component E